MSNGLIWLGVVLYACIVSAEWYDTYTGNQITELRLQELRLNNLIPYCAVEVKECDIEEARRMDASCNNVQYPSRGARMTPFERLLPPDYAIGGGLKTTKMGMPLPNARRLRMSLVPDARISNKKFTHLLTNMAVFIAGDTTTVHDSINYLVMTTTCCLPGGDQDPRCMPIRVPNDDLYLRNTNVRCLNLTRAITYQRLGCIPDTLPPERVNTATPILDLSHVYGTETAKALRVREMSAGRLRTDKLKGKEWPPGNGTGCVLNEAAQNETRCHDAAEVNVNSLLPVNMAFIWFVRQHNYLAGRLAKVNPCWDDDKLYVVAKDINIAIWQNIVYYELFPNLLGFEFLVKAGVVLPGRGHVDDYDPRLEPRTYLEQVITSRWFHTLQEGRLNLYDNRGKVLRQLAVVELTLHTGILPNNNTIEGLTQGAFRQPCASNDMGMDPDMGQRVLGPMQTVADVMADDIMKARDAGLPSYNRYREFCHLPAAKDFEDLMGWMPKTHVESLKLLYDDVEDIELMTGILSEKPAVGVMPPTLACIMVEQLMRWRRSDRFWFENTSHQGRFTPEQLREVRKMTMSKLMCDHGDSVDAVQYNAFQLPGPGNELIPCSEHLDIDIEAWRDHSCAKDAYNQVYEYTADYGYQQLQNYMNIGDNTRVTSQSDG